MLPHKTDPRPSTFRERVTIRGAWTVLHAPDLPEQLPPIESRPDEEIASLPHCNVNFHPVETFPSCYRGPVNELSLTDEEFDEYCKLLDEPFNGGPKHQVSGFPSPEQQDDMELECQLVTNGLYCGDTSGYEDPALTSFARAPAIGVYCYNSIRTTT